MIGIPRQGLGPRRQRRQRTNQGRPKRCWGWKQNPGRAKFGVKMTGASGRGGGSGPGFAAYLGRQAGWPV